ncbi:MAG: TatD family hydrolase [Veillonellaceae bacterium]|jgi:TatD DNase family protein|nr:TatD family hydrolase [Veillonellaceae bacterium]
MLFDSHAHLDNVRFNDDLEEVIKRARENGVTGIINAGACMESSAASIRLAEQYDSIYAAVGVHPHDVKDIKPGDYDQLAEWTKHPKVVAIGEIGLDYYYNHSPKEVQHQALIAQIDVARQTGMPIIIHDRDAHGDVLQIIKKEAKGLTGVFHCFSGSMEMMREVVAMGFYAAFGGSVTFKNAAKLPAIAAAVPLERLLLETDCPYLTPEPKRGRRNEPAHVKYVAEYIAKLRNMEFTALAEATTDNAKRLFGID